ncbi:MAG TPA: DUF4381 domain-containing protein [Aeromonadales bacterium]|nr:DUF4381 domain-containing protein [Aeromonadales bacterium]
MNPQQLPLRDIHLPATVDWWPLAPIWWVLLALVIVTPVAIIQYRKWKQARFITIALNQFCSIKQHYQQHQDSSRYIKELSILLRQCVMTLASRGQTASVTGEKWLQLLDQLGQTDQFTQGVGRMLITAPYKDRPVEKIEELESLVTNWIKTAYKQKPQHKVLEIHSGGQHA